MGKKFDFDYIIIGSGPAGRAAALTLSKSKKLRIAIVEEKKFGGSAINTRDIPYYIGLNFANTFSNFKNYPEFRDNNIHFNLPTAVSHSDFITSEIQKATLKEFEEAGITKISGPANFLTANKIAVGVKEYTASNFIIATGSKLKCNEISGLDTVPHLTPNTALSVRRAPKAVLIVGGGSTGCEIAEYYAALGSKVLIMERSEHLLPREDKEVGDTLADYFKNELGIMVLPNCKVVALEQDNLSKRVIFSTNHQEKVVRVETVVLATGSGPILDCGLENAGVKFKNTGIIVNKLFQTSAKNIYAIGDAIGGTDTSIERAEYEGTLLGANILNKSKNLVNYNGFIRTTGTYPEIAVVGMNEYDLLKRDQKCKRATVKLDTLLPSKVTGNTYGFVKILADHSGHIIGATIVAPNASSMISELALAVRHRLTTLEIASTPHITLNYSSAIKLAAKQLAIKK